MKSELGMSAKTYKRNTIILAAIFGSLCGAVMYGFWGMVTASIWLAH